MTSHVWLQLKITSTRWIYYKVSDDSEKSIPNKCSTVTSNDHRHFSQSQLSRQLHGVPSLLEALMDNLDSGVEPGTAAFNGCAAGIWAIYTPRQVMYNVLQPAPSDVKRQKIVTLLGNLVHFLSFVGKAWNVWTSWYYRMYMHYEIIKKKQWECPFLIERYKTVFTIFIIIYKLINYMKAVTLT